MNSDNTFRKLFLASCVLFLLGISLVDCFVFTGNSSQVPPQIVAKAVSMILPSHGQVNKDIFLEVEFAKGVLVQSAIPSIKIVILQSPKNSCVDTLSAVPKTKLRFDTAGEYTLEVKVGYLLKST